MEPTTIVTDISKKQTGAAIKYVKASASKQNELTFSSLCKLVTSSTCAYEDVAEKIEDKAYEECGKGKLDRVIKKLHQIAEFFSCFDNKNEEIIRDLADVYILMGQIYQYSGHFQDSVNMFTKAIIVDDQYSVPYHSCAISYLKLGLNASAIKSIEQEIILSPGNYYSYLLLADLYKGEKMFEKEEDTLKRLLERDPENIQGLHRLIVYYEKHKPGVDIQLLRRHLLKSQCKFNRSEAVIRVYHLCCDKRYQDALEFITEWHKNAPEVSIVHLVKAYLYGEMKQFTKKRFELALFKEKNNGSEESILARLSEFGNIFGETAAKRLAQRLILSVPFSFSSASYSI
ncbi:MAG: hypothetical protein GX640_13915 [Fibrobacter sp.]|nr:hypothetical protein [Fibrobacter sp.]